MVDEMRRDGLVGQASEDARYGGGQAIGQPVGVVSGFNLNDEFKRAIPLLYEYQLRSFEPGVECLERHFEHELIEGGAPQLGPALFDGLGMDRWIWQSANFGRWFGGNVGGHFRLGHHGHIWLWLDVVVTRRAFLAAFEAGGDEPREAGAGDGLAFG